MVAEELAQPFDLINGPLLRVKLYRLDAREHVLVVTVHHIVSDGWSSQLMVEEFVHLYDAIAHQRESRLPALPIQYADFALWQRSWMEAGESERQLQYWTKMLGEEQPLLALPLDRERPPVPSYRGAALTADCSPALSQALKTWATSAVIPCSCWCWRRSRWCWPVRAARATSAWARRTPGAIAAKPKA